MKNILIAVLLLLTAGRAVAAMAETRASVAAEIIRQIGRTHHAENMRGIYSEVRLPHGSEWPGSESSSLTAMGEAALMYMEAVTSAKSAQESVVDARGRVAQARALAVLAGPSEEVAMAVARQEKRLASAERTLALCAERRDALKNLMIEAGWAAPREDGMLDLKAEWRRDMTSSWSGGGYDGAG